MNVSMSWLQRSPASSISFTLFNILYFCFFFFCMFLESYGIWEGIGEHQFGAFKNESLIFYMRCSVQRFFYACLISCDVCWIKQWNVLFGDSCGNEGSEYCTSTLDIGEEIIANASIHVYGNWVWRHFLQSVSVIFSGRKYSMNASVVMYIQYGDVFAIMLW